MAAKNGHPRDLLARRLLGLEREQKASNIRLEGLALELGRLRDDLNTGVRALLAGLDRLADKLDAVAALGPRVGALEARVAELEAKRPDA